MAVVFPVSWGWAIAAERGRPPETATLVAFAGGFALLAFLFIVAEVQKLDEMNDALMLRPQ